MILTKKKKNLIKYIIYNTMKTTIKITLIILTIVSLSSCMVSKPHHACGITEWNKQYVRCR